MTVLSIILNIVLILISIVLIAVVLMQQGQRQGLGAIAGGAETFFGKNKAKGLDAKLAKITKICAVAFIVLAIVCTIVVSHINKGTESVDLESTLTEAVDEANEEAEATDEAEVATEEVDEVEAPAEDTAEDAGVEADEAPAAE